MFCEKCQNITPEDLPPRFWRLVKVNSPYLLPYHYCGDRCYTHEPSMHVADFYHDEGEANLALITWILSR